MVVLKSVMQRDDNRFLHEDVRIEAEKNFPYSSLNGQDDITIQNAPPFISPRFQTYKLQGQGDNLAHSCFR